MTVKKKPVRKCIACRQQGEKNNFFRIVRLKDNDILLDFTGKANGRGAYLCKNLDCFEKAKKENSFQRAFKCKVSEQTFDEILAGINRVTKA